MFLVAVIVFLVIPIVEITAMVLVADAIGVGPMLASLVAISLIGAWLVKREGIAVMGRFRRSTANGEIPTTELLEGFLLFCAGVLCVVPGFVTDLIGLSLLVPVVRSMARGRLTRRFGFLSSMPGGRSFRRRQVVDVEWIGDVTPSESSPEAPIAIEPRHD